VKATHNTRISKLPDIANQKLETVPFRWSEFDAYLFDIDGTLLNSRDGVHYYAFRNALRALFGIDGTIDGVPVHGNTDLGILRAVLERAGISGAEFEHKLPDLVRHMCEEVQANAADIRVELCPSIRDLLELLYHHGKLLGVVSGNLEAIGWAKLEVAGLRHYFSFGSFSDERESREHIFRHGLGEVRQRVGEHASVCIVGDTPSDIAAARAVKAPIISVATGIFAQEQLAALNPDLCVGCCSELLT
jgi:phosphoglycolate phosphatase-like HAD superfamily hydrolase